MVDKQWLITMVRSLERPLRKWGCSGPLPYMAMKMAEIKGGDPTH